MTTRKRTTTAMIAAVFALSAVGAAVADEHESEPPEEPTADVVTTIWNDETHILVVTIDDEDAEEGACDTVTTERDEDGDIVLAVGEEEVGEENPLPEGCLIFDGEGPNGQVNHGTIVSAVAKNVSPHDLEGSKGELMRVIAKLSKDEVTKVKATGGADDDEGEGEEPKVKEAKLDRGNPGRGKGHSK